MKTRLLKKLRKEADKALSVRGFINSEGETIYNIGNRREVESRYGYSCRAIKLAFSIKEALKILEGLKRNYILSIVKDKKKIRDEERINEKLKKALK